MKVKSSATPNRYTEGHVLSNQWFLLLFAILFSNKFSDEWVILLITCFKIKTMHFVHIHNARKLPLTTLQSIDISKGIAFITIVSKSNAILIF